MLRKIVQTLPQGLVSTLGWDKDEKDFDETLMSGLLGRGAGVDADEPLHVLSLKRCRRRADLNAWRQRIRADAEEMFGGQDQDIFAYFGHDVDNRMRTKWCAQVFLWILSLSKAGFTDEILGRLYIDLLAKIDETKRQLKDTKRAKEFAECVSRYAPAMLDTKRSLASWRHELVENISEEEEQLSLLYHFLRQRPDIVPRGTSSKVGLCVRGHP